MITVSLLRIMTFLPQNYKNVVAAVHLMQFFSDFPFQKLFGNIHHFQYYIENVLRVTQFLTRILC
jgi:hypothetical protein